MTIKIEKQILKKFLDKIKMDKEQKINELVLDFTKEGLKVNVDDPANLVKIMGLLKKECFKEYEEIGKIGVNQFETFIFVINRFDDVIVMEHSGNLITIKGKNKKVDVELIDVNFIQASTESPKLEFNNTFIMPKGKLQEIYDDIIINKDTVLNIQTAVKKINFSCTGKYKFNTTYDAVTCNGRVNVKFGQPLINATNKLIDEDLELSLESNYPIKIIEKGKEMTIVVIVAPRVDNEDDNTEETTENEEGI